MQAAWQRQPCRGRGRRGRPVVAAARRARRGRHGAHGRCHAGTARPHRHPRSCGRHPARRRIDPAHGRAARLPRVGRGGRHQPARHLLRQPGGAAGDASSRSRRHPERVVEVRPPRHRLRRAVLRVEVRRHRLQRVAGRGSGPCRRARPGHGARPIRHGGASPDGAAADARRHSARVTRCRHDRLDAGDAGRRQAGLSRSSKASAPISPPAPWLPERR